MAENKHVASAGDVVEAMTGKPQPTFHGFETVSCSGETGSGEVVPAWFGFHGGSPQVAEQSPSFRYQLNPHTTKIRQSFRGASCGWGAEGHPTAASTFWWQLIKALECRQNSCRCWCIGRRTCHESIPPNEPCRKHTHQSNPYRSCSSWWKGGLRLSGIADHGGHEMLSWPAQEPPLWFTVKGPPSTMLPHIEVLLIGAGNHHQCWPHLHPLPTKHHGTVVHLFNATKLIHFQATNLHLLHMNHLTARARKLTRNFMAIVADSCSGSPAVAVCGAWAKQCHMVATFVGAEASFLYFPCLDMKHFTVQTHTIKPSAEFPACCLRKIHQLIHR